MLSLYYNHTTITVQYRVSGFGFGVYLELAISLRSSRASYGSSWLYGPSPATEFVSLLAVEGPALDKYTRPIQNPTQIRVKKTTTGQNTIWTNPNTDEERETQCGTNLDQSTKDTYTTQHESASKKKLDKRISK